MKYKLLKYSLLSLLIMLCGNVFAQDPEVTLDFTTNDQWNLPTANTKTEGTYTNADSYTITLGYGTAGNGYKYNSGYLIFGQTNSYLTLPAFDFAVEKIVVTGRSGASTAVGMNIFVGEQEASTATTGAEGTNTYEIADAYQSAGNIYTLKVTTKHNTQVTKIEVYKKTSGQTDTRTATTVELGEATTSGVVGATIALPTATVKAGDAAVEGAAVIWSSDNEAVATIDGTNVKLLAAGTAKITASFAETDTYKGSSASFTLTVTKAPYTSIADMLNDVTSTKTDVTFNFKDMVVTYVNGSYTYVHQSRDGDMLLYGADLGLVVDQVYDGTLTGKLYTYNGLPEIAVNKNDITATPSDKMIMVDIAIIDDPDDLSKYVNKRCDIQNAEFVSADGKNLTFKANSKEFVARNNFNINITGLEAGKIYNLSGMGAIFNDAYQLYPISFSEVQVAPAEFRNFAAVVNNQEGTLLTAEEQVQGTAVSFGIAVAEDGTVSRVAADNAQSIATISGNYHSEHGLTGMKVVVAVPGAVKIQVGQCTYSSKEIKVTNAAGEVVATTTPATACWKNDRNNVTELIYKGDATTLTITGMDYCPFVAVKEYVAPAEFQDFNVIVNNQEGTLLTTEEQVQGTAVEFGVAVDEQGNIIRLAADDAKSIATVSGKFHSDHGMTGLKVVTAVPGAVKILVGKCTYSTNTITVTNSEGEKVIEYTPQGEQGSGDLVCWKNDRNNVIELIYNGDATTLTITGMGYCPFIAVQKYEEAPAGFVDFEITNADMSGEFDTSKLPAGVTFSGTQRNDSHGYGNVTLTVPVTGKTTFTIGGCQYANPATCKITNAAGELLEELNLKTATCYHQDGAVVTYVYKGEPTTLTFSDIAYLPYFKAVGEKEKEKITLDNEPATATFAFDQGTEGQTATFSNANYFLNSKVAHGEGLALEGKDNKSMNQTWFNPAAKDGSANEGNAIRFLFTPKPGFTFTPTKVSFKSTRFGTNGGKLDIAWQNTDGTTVSLASDILPNRDNGTNPAIAEEAGKTVSELSYDVTGATPGEGTCGLKINLYSLDAGKHVGFADIIIEGTLSGTEMDVPVLASFKVNGNEYAVEDVFGEAYEATLELPKAQTMVSSENPLTDLAASSGEIGTVVYEAGENTCKVTIPMTAGSTEMSYVLNVVFKPDFTLSYIAVDGTTVLKTQIVEKDAPIGEFAYNIADVASSKNGYKARGWFKQNYVGEKFTTADVITADTKLYAIETEIETPSDSRKYVFDLGNQFFYAEDHEGFNSIGSGYWHDKQHGWAFNNGDKIELLVGKKATINFSLCQYSKAEATIEGSNGASISAVAESDGGAGSFDYEGEGGTLTLTINSTGAVYIHSITVFNTTETNYTKQGEWLIVKKDDASSLLDAIEVAKGIENAKIFVPDGTYDLGQTVKTIISGKNVSLIGQSAENTIIVNRPAQEGLDVADLLKNTGEGLYMQDLSLKNDFSYAGNDGRAASLHDTGTKTIAKNVFLLSHQDTYYSHKVGGLYYWEGGELHGTVDYLCGNGKAYFNKVKLVNEVRGSATITANSETYVFNGCVVENNAGTYNFGRAWSDNPTCVYLNTTLLDGGEKLASTRWNLNGLNCDYRVAGEYGTMDANGNNITPESNNVTFTKQNTQMNTILDATALETYSIENVLGEWAATAQADARQLAAPTDAKYENGTVTWTPGNDGAIAYALFKNGEFVGIAEGNTFDIEAAENDKLTIRSANRRGGFGPEGDVEIVGEEPLDPDLIEIPQDQGKDLDTNPRAELVEGEKYNTYSAKDDLSVAFKMTNIDVKDCDYVVVKFAEPVAAGWVIAFWNGLDTEAIPAGATEYKYVFADDPKCAIENDILPQICMLTLWGAEKPLVAKVSGVYKHKVPAKPMEVAVNVERYPGLGYGVTEATVDFTEAKAYLGVEEVTTDMLRIVNPDGTTISDYAPYDGWFNGEGAAETWGANTKINVKFYQAIPEGKFTICDMNGADEVGKSYTVKWALEANEKKVVFPITVTFVEKPVITLTFADLNKVDENTVALTSELGKCYEGLTADVDVAAILAKLGVESLSDVTIYAVQSDGSLDDNYKLGTTDGWRNAAGDWQGWGNDAFFYVKADFTRESAQIYEAGGMENKNTEADTENPASYTATYAFVKAGSNDAVVLKVTLTYVVPSAINTLKTAINNGTVYNLRGQKVTKTQKGLYIINGKKVVK